MASDNRQKPNYSITTSEEMRDRVRQIAEAERRSLSATIEHLVWEALSARDSMENSQ